MDAGADSRTQPGKGTRKREAESRIEEVKRVGDKEKGGEEFSFNVQGVVSMVLINSTFFGGHRWAELEDCVY